MHSLERSFLSSLKLPAELSAGISSLNRLRTTLPPRYPSLDLPPLPHNNLKHTSEESLKGYQEALALIHEHRPALSIESLLAIHKRIFYYLDDSGGHFKTQNNYLISTEVNGDQELIHTPFPADDIPKAMDCFIERYKMAIATTEPLIVIPLALMDYILIHPFMDGNGRSFRLLSVLLLYQSGFQCVRQLDFDNLLKISHHSGRAALKQGLKGWSQGQHNVIPWLTYFLGALSYAISKQSAASHGQKVTV
jgi:Fic family protein